jgi:hypothetical protein
MPPEKRFESDLVTSRQQSGHEVLIAHIDQGRLAQSA